MCKALEWTSLAEKQSELFELVSVARLYTPDL